MTFDVPADAYARFMGRFSEPLADLFVELGGVSPGDSALDVGCGPGVLTARLVDRLGVGNVAAVDPSPSFVEAAKARLPGVDVRSASAEDLPYDDGAFDATYAQLVVHFMRDPVAGLHEMARVTRPGGIVTACVWDHAAEGGPLAPYWRVVRQLDPDAPDESDLPGTREGQLADYARRAGLGEVEAGSLPVEAEFASFEDWWEPYTFGIGPAGQYVAGLGDARRDELRDACAASLPDGSFTIRATAWSVRGRA